MLIRSCVGKKDNKPLKYRFAVFAFGFDLCFIETIHCGFRCCLNKNYALNFYSEVKSGRQVAVENKWILKKERKRLNKNGHFGV